MSILNFFKRTSPQERGIFVPPAVATDSLFAYEIATCNNEVQPVQQRVQGGQPKQYHSYSSKYWAEIRHYAAQHGHTSASRRFAKLLGHPVPESTVRKYRNPHHKELEGSRKCHADSIPDITELPLKKRGHTLLLSEFDGHVQEYVRVLRHAGGVVNTEVVIASARGLIMARNCSLMCEFGAHLDPDKPWAKSFLRRMGFVKRRATTSACLAVVDFEAVKTGFLERKAGVVQMHNIPKELIIDLDGTGL